MRFFNEIQGEQMNPFGMNPFKMNPFKINPLEINPLARTFLLAFLLAGGGGANAFAEASNAGVNVYSYRKPQLISADV